QRLEQLVHRAIASGKRDERRRILHEHRLAHKEVAKVDGPLYPLIRALLEGQLDVAADRQPATLFGAAIGRFHDTRTTAGDDREAFLGEHARGLARGRVEMVSLQGPRRAE